MTLDRLRDTFFHLVRIDSPSLYERNIAQYVATQLTQLGFDVIEDQAGQAIGGNAGNVIGTRRGNPEYEPVLLTAHLDSVPPCIGIDPVEGPDGFVTSRGDTVLGADDKAGVAAILWALESLIPEGRDLPTLQVVFTVAEEIGLQGAKHLNREDLIAKYGIALDTGGQVGTFVVAGPSQMKWEATVMGRKAHAGVAPETGISAIKVAAEAVSRMPHGRLDKDTTVNIGSFIGEGPTNVVNDTVRLVGEARSHDRGRLDRVLDQIETSFQDTALRHGATSRFEKTLSYEGYRFESDHPLRRMVEHAVERIGLQPVGVERGGGSDANVFAELGIPTVNLAIGYEHIHTASERIRLADIAKAADLVQSFCLGPSHERKNGGH